MRVRLAVEDGAAAELSELSDWLGQESALRGLVAPAPAVPAPGELGALTDALVVAVGGGGAVSVLAASLKAFLTQPRRSDVRLVVSTPDGRRVEVDARRVDDVEALLRQALGEGEPK
ncbi:hypothetical protein ACFZB9_15885 [Kitasatospora sp. NPDC008050]|uniref:effector-associated constant component EACC1 n=1 Tax=Kitasatospora sp. NPDC008050 TaxID=3364021 RepID=UPI0036E6F580